MSLNRVQRVGFPQELHEAEQRNEQAAERN